MAVWCKGLPLTDCSLSPHARFASRAYEEVTRNLGLGGGFRWVLRFPPPGQTGQSRLSRNMVEKVTKNRNTNKGGVEKTEV